jgi:regulator of sirC expression with transglutaminase-like and TPR domain
MRDERTLLQVLDQPDDQIDLGRAALLLARCECPGLDVERELARLEALAEAARLPLSIHKASLDRVKALRLFLAETCGFRGNEQDYYDPKNSCLNHVLDRRVGIPITLSVLYMEVGRRLGAPLAGVGLPGHFLLKYYDSNDDALFIDPFHGGRFVDSSGCRDLVRRMYEGRLSFHPSFLEPVDKRYIVLRMLNNLRSIYVHGQQFSKALRVIEMILAITPASSDDLKQRGLIHYKLGHYKQARQDLEACLFLNPQSADAEAIQQTIAELKRLTAMLN